MAAADDLPPAGRTPFRRSFTPAAADIDELGHVNNAVHVRWLQEIATAHWRALADPAQVDACLWVVVRHEIDYRRPVLPGETVTATTWVGNAPRGARFDRHVVFTGPDGTVRARAVTIWAMIDRATQRPLRISAAVVAPFLA